MRVECLKVKIICKLCLYSHGFGYVDAIVERVHIGFVERNVFLNEKTCKSFSLVVFERCSLLQMIQAYSCSL